jgi:hypothetical protein
MMKNLMTYSSRNIFTVSKSQNIRKEGHEAHMGRGKIYSSFGWGNLRERDQLENPGVDGKVILRLTFRNLDVVVWTGWCLLRIWTDGRYL